MSFKPEVSTDGGKSFAGNALRFATREEAEANVRDLMMRWFLVTDTRVVESEDEVSHAWVDGKLVDVPKVVSFTGVRFEPTPFSDDQTRALVNTLNLSVGFISTEADRNRLRWYMQRWVKELKL